MQNENKFYVLENKFYVDVGLCRMRTSSVLENKFYGDVGLFRMLAGSRRRRQQLGASL